MLVRLTDKTPEADDVTAGGWGALMFGLLLVAFFFLMRSFVKQLRKTAQAKQAGAFGDEPVAPEASSNPPNDETTTHRGK